MDPETPESLFMETADVRTLKSGNLDLQVFASIGGWTFSDNNTKTQPVFGNIAKNEGNRQKFADNVVSFMKEFGFDGVDIDWEYPGAPDRGGHEDDTKNYVALMKTMKDTFDKEAKGKYGLTFTVPTSYWYLRWFDLPGMLKHADWVNVMSYDLHGMIICAPGLLQVPLRANVWNQEHGTKTTQSVILSRDTRTSQRSN